MKKKEYLPSDSTRSEGVKLVLFDIDGTLISGMGAEKYEISMGGTENKYAYAIRKCLGVECAFDFSKRMGGIDRHTLWLACQQSGVARELFEERFDCMCQCIYEYFLNQPLDKAYYRPIPDSQKQVKALARRKDVRLGVITGNIRPVADWKLAQTGVGEHFSFGLYGDEADDRLKLAGLAFERAQQSLGIDFAPQDVTIVGDTIFDIRSGKAIGAYTIVLNTHGAAAMPALLAERPTLAVDSLADSRVYQYFGME
jgi:phosphoglycolate phosphatase